MKFKRLNLDESLFDDDVDNMFGAISLEDDSIDDDFGLEDLHNPVAPEGPKMGSDTGVADLIMTAINGEYDTIKEYNSIIATLNYEGKPEYIKMIPILEEINNEEQRHIGQLQELLKIISPSAQSVEEGKVEAQGQLKFVDGKLPVQTMDYASPKMNNNAPNQVDTICTLSDIDDDM